MLEVIVETPSLEGLGTFTAAVLVPEVSLEAGGQVRGTSGTGAVQGDPVSGTFQACGIQPSLVTLDRECMTAGGMARGGADDVFAVGPPEVVIPAVQRFAVDIAARCNLQLQWSNSMVFC